MSTMHARLEQLPITLSWASDETLYSWCCRWHRLTLNRTQVSGLALFGVPSAAKVRIAPNPFGHFSSVTRGLLGAPAAILRQRTAVGSFLALARLDDRQLIEAGDLNPSHVLSEKTGIAMRLRYCCRCIKRCQRVMGMSIWRVQHQLPGVVVCLEHGQPLVELLEQRQLWSMPDSGAVREIDVASQPEMQTLSYAAEAALCIFESGGLDVDELRERARSVVSEAYGALDTKRLNPERVDSDWQMSPLSRWCNRVFPGASAFPSMWITNLLRSRRSERSPLRWAFLVAYFSERSWSSPRVFFSSARDFSGSQLSFWGNAADVPSLILHACTKSENANQAARIIGVTAGTVRHWVRRHAELSSATAHWKSRG